MKDLVETRCITAFAIYDGLWWQCRLLFIDSTISDVVSRLFHRAQRFTTKKAAGSEFCIVCKGLIHPKLDQKEHFQLAGKGAASTRAVSRRNFGGGEPKVLSWWGIGRKFPIPSWLKEGGSVDSSPSEAVQPWPKTPFWHFLSVPERFRWRKIEFFTSVLAINFRGERFGGGG